MTPRRAYAQESKHPMTLLTETEQALRRRNKEPGDVRWVGGAQYWFSWDEFARLAAEIGDDEGDGQTIIAEDLVIVGEAWWLQRGADGGSEWWQFRTAPVQPQHRRVPETLRASNDARSAQFGKLPPK